MARYLQHPSLAACWNGKTLEPFPDAIAAELTVWFALPPNDSEAATDGAWEGLLATAVADDTVRLCAVPAHLQDVNFGDEVKVIRSAEEALVATSIGNRSDQWTYRIFLPDGSGDVWLPIAEFYAKAGCLVDVVSPRLIALSCCRDIAQAVADLLLRDQDAGRFVYETGRLQI